MGVMLLVGGSLHLVFQQSLAAVNMWSAAVVLPHSSMGVKAWSGAVVALPHSISTGAPAMLGSWYDTIESL